MKSLNAFLIHSNKIGYCFDAKIITSQCKKVVSKISRCVSMFSIFLPSMLNYDDAKYHASGESFALFFLQS